MTPESGFYPGVSMGEYHRWDAASNSRLTRLKRSPAHMKAYIDEPPKDRLALAIGRAVHSSVLEPDTFDSVYTVAGQCDATKKDGERCSNPGLRLHAELGWLCGQHSKSVPQPWSATNVVLPAADLTVCQHVRQSVLAHKSASRLLTGRGENELSVVWVEDSSGVTCKARFDRLSPEIAGGAIVDIKTTKDASPREFERSIFSHGYHRQGALYLDAAQAVGLKAEHFVIIAVEKEAPFAVAVYRLTDGAIEAGRDQLRPLLKTYGMCAALDTWPAYPDQVQDIALPAYAWGQIDEDTREAA